MAGSLGPLKSAEWRIDRILLVVAVICGIFFLFSLDNLWPLAPVNLHLPRARAIATARYFLAEQGVSTTGTIATTELNVDTAVLDYLERTLGRRYTERLLRNGLPVITYEVVFRTPGTADATHVSMLPSGRIVSWRRPVQDDDGGARLSKPAARALARRTLQVGLRLDVSDWKEISVSERRLSDRNDYGFTYERRLPGNSELRERTLVRVAGDSVVFISRPLILPPRWLEKRITAEGPRRAVSLAGVVLMVGSAFGAYLVFLLRLRDGTARLRRPLFWSGVVFLCTLSSALLEFRPWNPLEHPLIATFSGVFEQVQGNLWTIIALMAIVSAADATDRKMGANRGDSLWQLTQGALFNRQVGRAALRGFLVGLLCAGLMAASVRLLEWGVGARVELQPRGFFLTMLNSQAPALWSLLYFLHIALLEELGYRYFAGTWLLSVTRRPWIAILLPALVYGLTHTDLPFLPPAEPFWARPLVMTLVGCIWGWAFLRFDALTVVVSHLTSDLFIFNWPQIASGNPALVIPALLAVALPAAARRCPAAPRPWHRAHHPSRSEERGTTP